MHNIISFQNQPLLVFDKRHFFYNKHNRIFYLRDGAYIPLTESLYRVPQEFRLKSMQGRAGNYAFFIKSDLAYRIFIQCDDSSSLYVMAIPLFKEQSVFPINNSVPSIYANVSGCGP